MKGTRIRVKRKHINEPIKNQGLRPRPIGSSPSTSSTPTATHGVSSSPTAHSPQFEVSVDNDNATICLPDDYNPNESRINEITRTPQIYGETQYIERMNSNSYDGGTFEYSDYKTKLIRDMTNSVINETNLLFGQYRQEETRPYEEQREYQESMVKKIRNKQMAKNITSKYTQDDI